MEHNDIENNNNESFMQFDNHEFADQENNIEGDNNISINDKEQNMEDTDSEDYV